MVYQKIDATLQSSCLTGLRTPVEIVNLLVTPGSRLSSSVQGRLTGGLPGIEFFYGQGDEAS